MTLLLGCSRLSDNIRYLKLFKLVLLCRPLKPQYLKISGLILVLIGIWLIRPIQPATDLTYEDEKWYEDGELFSGRVYGSAKMAREFPQVFALSFYDKGDSIVAKLKEGQVVSVKSFLKGYPISRKELSYSNGEIVNMKQYQIQAGLWNVSQLMFETNLRKGKDHGQTVVNRDAVKSIIEYRNGDRLKETKYYREQKLFGLKLSLHEVAEFDENDRYKSKVVYYADGEKKLEESEYIDGRIFNSKTYSANGVVIKEVKEYKPQNIVLEGLVEYQNYGTRTLINYKSGKKSGVEKIYYPNGTMWEETMYSNDLKHGKSKKWYKNGELAEECTYQNNRIDGIFKKWYDSGKRWEESIYSNGEITSVKKWYKDGKPAF